MSQFNIIGLSERCSIDVTSTKVFVPGHGEFLRQVHWSQKDNKGHYFYHQDKVKGIVTRLFFGSCSGTVAQREWFRSIDALLNGHISEWENSQLRLTTTNNSPLMPNDLFGDPPTPPSQPPKIGVEVTNIQKSTLFLLEMSVDGSEESRRVLSALTDPFVTSKFETKVFRDFNQLNALTTTRGVDRGDLLVISCHAADTDGNLPDSLSSVLPSTLQPIIKEFAGSILCTQCNSDTFASALRLLLPEKAIYDVGKINHHVEVTTSLTVKEQSFNLGLRSFLRAGPEEWDPILWNPFSDPILDYFDPREIRIVDDKTEYKFKPSDCEIPTIQPPTVVENVGPLPRGMNADQILPLQQALTQLIKEIPSVEVYLKGSAVQGHSWEIKKDADGRPRNRLFGDHSDYDFLLVYPELINAYPYGKETLRDSVCIEKHSLFKKHFDKWKTEAWVPSSFSAFDLFHDTLVELFTPRRINWTFIGSVHFILTVERLFLQLKPDVFLLCNFSDCWLPQPEIFNRVPPEYLRNYDTDHVGENL